QSVQTGTITIVANDNGNTGTGGAKTAQAVINVQTVPPTLPFAVNDSKTIAEGSGATNIDVLANDLINSGATASITAVTQPPTGDGTVAINGTLLVYTPPADPDFFTPNGPFTFTYTMTDTGTNSQPSTGTVSVNITNVPDAPVAVNDAYQTAI